ncbi:MAG TPA: polysaccharide lyase [Acidobacteriaceae bacterium]|nr:polysaccharide lyase [Acidobacteriaceae bacterium]
MPILLLLFATLPALAQTLPAPGTPMDVYDGFEGAKLSPLWETTPVAPGALSLQSAIVRAGHGAIQITLHANDKFEAGQHGDADSERDELLEARALTSKENIGYEYSWSMYLPADFPIVPVRLVVAQWKQYCGSDTAPCSDDSPVLAVRYVDGVLRITQSFGRSEKTVLYEEKRDLRGHWLGLRFQARFTPQANGFVRVWLDGKQVVDFTGVTADAENAATGYTTPGYYYFKMGLYRNVMPQPMTIYLDEYRKKQLPSDATSTGRPN